MESVRDVVRDEVEGMQEDLRELREEAQALRASIEELSREHQEAIAHQLSRHQDWVVSREKVNPWAEWTPGRVARYGVLIWLIIEYGPEVREILGWVFVILLGGVADLVR